MRRALLVVVVALVGCSGGATRIARPYPAPTADAILAELAARRARAKSFLHVGGTMEFWRDGERQIKIGVDVMGRIGSRLRLQAQDPGGGMTMADLACDGARFTFVDFQKDCQLAGACSEESIAALLQVRIAPDDFVLLALGQPPILAGETRASVTWDASRGAEVVELAAADGRRQRLVLDGRRGKGWDVVEARAFAADGAVDWTLEQKDFAAIPAAGGETLRAGRKLRFVQPGTKGDLTVEWADRSMNVELGEEKFALAPPAGLGECARGAPPVAPAPLPSGE